MTIIGIDVSKDELVGVRINKSGQQQDEYCVANTQAAIDLFLASLTEKHKRLVIACESTGDFHRELAFACFGKEIPFRLLNPITTRQFVKVTVRGRKTDVSDALVIAKLALQGEGRYMQKEDFMLTKPVCRAASKLSEMERALSQMERRAGRLNKDDTEVAEIIGLCRAKLDDGVKKLRKHVHKHTDRKLEKLLTSIPGIGITIADILIAEIGDIGRFPSGKSLVAFAGIDPRVKQSGVSLKRNIRITKRGSPHLRYVLYFATVVAQLHDQEFKDHFVKKTAEGKSYTEATLSGARKMAYRIYAVWKRGTPYVVKTA